MLSKVLSTAIYLLLGQGWLVAGYSIVPDWRRSASTCTFITPDTRDIATTNYVHLVKSVQLMAGTNYRYIVSEPCQPEKPWLLFVHGFPSTTYDWRHQVEYFTNQGYGIIAPDLLGYGGTDNPSDLNRFALKKAADEIKEILDCENIQKVIAVGHDYGSAVVSRLITYLPEQIIASAFLGIGYAPPPIAFNEAGIEAVNNATLATIGYDIFGYWFFMNDDGAASTLDAHFDSAYSLIYTDDPDYLKNNFAPTGKLEKFLLQDRVAPWEKHLDCESKAVFKRILGLHGGFNGPVKSYQALMRDVNAADEAAIPPSKAMIPHPVLLLTAAKDKVGLPEIQINNTKPYARDIRIGSIQSGHFLQLEQPDQVNEELHQFVDDVLRNATIY